MFALCLLISGNRSLEGSTKFSIVWATDTHSGTSNYLQDLSGAALNAGQSINGDGDLVELGYFSEGSFDLPFQENAFKGEWIPLTQNTRIGDSSSGYGFSNGMFTFRTTFTRNQNYVTTYWGEPKYFTEYLDFEITSTTPPPQSTPVCVRFYDSPTKGGARFNSVSGQNWKWPSFPNSSSIPTTAYFKIASGNAPSGSFWVHGSTFEDPNNPFKTSLSTNSEISIANSIHSNGSGTFNDINNSYAWGTEISLSATADEHSFFAGWIGDGISEPWNENTTLIVGHSQTIYAEFHLEPYLLNLETRGYGEVDGSGSFTFGHDVNISAFPNYGHSFSHWEKNGSHYSSSANETISIDGNLDLVAVFTRNQYDVLIGSTLGGSYELLDVNGTVPLTYEHGMEYTLASIPDKHFGFSNWISTEAGLSMLENRNFAVTTLVPTADINITASFYELSYELNINSTQGYNSLSPSGKFPAFSNVPVQVETKEGFIFDYWQDPLGILVDPNSASTEANISKIYPYLSATVSAILRLDDYEDTDINITSEAGGNVLYESDETGDFTHFNLYELNATAQLGYEFDQWTGDTDQLQSGAFEKNNKFLIEGPLSLRATFHYSEYKLNISPNGYGSATGPATFTIENNPSVEAQAFPGARFTHWSGDTQYLLNHLSPETIIQWDNNSIPKDLDLVANFVPEIYQVSLKTEGNGSVDLFLSTGEIFYETPAKTLMIDSETEFTMDAIAGEGWTFSNWRGLPDISELLNPIAYIDQYHSVVYFYPYNDLNITAEFKIIEYDDSQIAASAGIGGDISIESEPSGNFLHFSTYDINATPYRGYEFTGWQADRALDSLLLNGISTPTNHLRIEGEMEINATFALLDYDIQITINGGGESTAPSTFTVHEYPVLTAIEDPGWNFSHWSGDSEYLLDPNATQTSIDHTSLPLQNLSFTANFIRETYTISLGTEGSGSLNLSQNEDEFRSGTTEELVNLDSATRLGVDAIPSSGWKFSTWFGLPQADSLRDTAPSLNQSSPSIHFIPVSDGNITAKFKRDVFSLTISQPGIGGSAEGEGDFLFETVVDVNATPQEHYQFKSWAGGEEYFVYDLSVANNQFRIPAADTSIQPVFEPKIYTINTIADENGTFSVSGTYNNITTLDQTEYNATSQITLSALPKNSDNHMLNYLYWENTIGESGFSYSSTFNIPFLDANYSFRAYFTERNEIGTKRASPPYGGSVGENPAYSSAQLQRLVANPNPDYSFIGWESKSGESFSDNWSLHTVDAQLQETSDIWGHFVKKTIFLTLEYNEDQGQVSGFSDEITYGDNLSLTANPNDNFTFVGWDLVKEITFKVDESFSTIHPSEKRIFVNNQESPELTLLKGFTYHFDCNLSNSDNFFLSTSQSNSTPDSYYLEGVTGHLTSNGRLTIEIPINAPDTLLYYHSSANNYAGNRIKIASIEDEDLLSAPSNAVFSNRITEHFGLRANFERTRHSITPISIGEGSLDLTRQGGDFLEGGAGDDLLVGYWGDLVTVSATPADHWYFSHWEGSGSAYLEDRQEMNTTLQIVEDFDIRANFQKVQYNVDVNASPPEYGLVDVDAPTQTYTYEENVTLSATPLVGKQFDEWSLLENVSLHHPEDRYKQTANFKVLGNAKVQANFSRIILDIDIQLLSLDENDLAISDDIGASVTRPETIYHGDSVTLSLSPFSGYTFLHWVDLNSGETISTQKSFNITLTSDRNLQAVLKKNHYQLEVSASNGGASEINATSPYYWGDKIGLLAMPEQHWIFSRWTGVGSENLENEFSQSTSLKMFKDSNILAEFQPIRYQLDISSSPEGFGGFSSIENYYIFGDTAQIEAIPRQGKLFHSWSIDENASFANGSNNTSNPASFIINGNTKLSAKFIPKEYSVSYQVVVVDEFNNIQNDLFGGRILGGKSFYDEDIAEFAISLSNGYKLKYWLDADSNSSLSTEKIYKHTMLSDLNLTAVVTERKYEVDMKISPSIGGYAQLNDYVISDSLTRSDFLYGSQVNVTAFAEDGYRFVKWDTIGINLDKPELSEQSFSIGNDIKITAYFAPEGLINLNIASQPEEAASYLFGGGSFEYNLEHSILALPKKGYLFSHWDFNGSEAIGVVNDVYSNTTTIALDGDKVITAVFKIDESSPPDSENSNKLYLLSVYSDNTGQGTTSGSGFFRGVRTIKAFPKEGYEFSHWEGGTFENSYAQTTQVTVLENTSVVAYFQSVGVFEDSESLDNGWWGNPWFGYFWKVGEEDWLFHEKLGWIFMKKKGDQSIWVWIQKMEDWFWTAKEHYPYLHSSSTESWYFVNLEKSNYQRLVIYDYLLSNWMSR